jgi:rRNA maturation endonuclease Nob1
MFNRAYPQPRMSFLKRVFLALLLTIGNFSKASISSDEDWLTVNITCKKIFEHRDGAPYVYERDSSQMSVVMKRLETELNGKYSLDDVAKMYVLSTYRAMSATPKGGDYRNAVFGCRKFFESADKIFRERGTVLKEDN